MEQEPRRGRGGVFSTRSGFPSRLSTELRVQQDPYLANVKVESLAEVGEVK